MFPGNDQTSREFLIKKKKKSFKLPCQIHFQHHWKLDRGDPSFPSILHNYRQRILTFCFPLFSPFYLFTKLFESSALMHLAAIKSLLSALHQLSHQCVAVASSAFGPASSQKFGSISFSVERMVSILVNNLHSM